MDNKQTLDAFFGFETKTKIHTKSARMVAKLDGLFDQSKGCTVRIVDAGHGDFLVHVRPKGRRREYTLRLSDLARITITRVALAEARG